MVRRIRNFILTLLLIFSIGNIFAQNINGRLVDQFGAGIPNAELKLYMSSTEYSTTSLAGGTFIFSGLTSVEGEELLPKDYSVSNNFPNPFNPETRLLVSLPKTSKVKVTVYNIIGQTVLDRSAEVLNAGTNQIDLKLDGLSNGIYLAQITIDDKYIVMRKLSLVYGSQHLSKVGPSSSSLLPKTSNKTSLSNIDSLVVTGANVVKTTFTNLPPYSGSNQDIGTFTVNIEMGGEPCPGIPTVTYSGKIYNTVQIGEQCWLKENLDVGTMINITTGAYYLQTDNGTIEKYCYDNDPANCATYGGLYEWPEAMQYSTAQYDTHTQGICPDGWHLPTSAEFQTLSTTVNGHYNSLKAIGQGTEDGAGTNESGFSALAAGHRASSFEFLSSVTCFWSSWENGINGAYRLLLAFSVSNFHLTTSPRSYGHSVRCVKD